jgi:outer membrane protein assembly factor BamB
MRTRSMIAWTAGALALALTARAADWPQYRGPDRTGVSKETGLLKTWPKDGPALAWTFDKAGRGYAGFAVVGDRVYTMGARDKVEYVIALDTKGAEQWAAKIGPMFDFAGNNWSAGPNATPTVDGDRIYGLGSQGILVCVDAKGAVQWSKNLPKELSAQVNPVGGGEDDYGWGYCWSPLVDGDNLILTPGGPKGLVAALNKKTGAVLWQSKEVTDQATYSSPIVADVEGVRQYVVMTQEGAVGVAAKDGKLLWTYKRRNEFPDVVCPTPIYHDGHVLLTATKGGCDVVKLAKAGDKFKATREFTTKDLANNHGGVVLVGKHVYGAHADRSWKCLTFPDLKPAWEARDLKTGSVVVADGHLYCLTEEGGEVVLVEATATKYVEKGRFALPKASKLRKPRAKVWTHPVVANGHLYLRDQELVFCYKVKG